MKPTRPGPSDYDKLGPKGGGKDPHPGRGGRKPCGGRKPEGPHMPVFVSFDPDGGAKEPIEIEDIMFVRKPMIV